jgi:tetratricopeptide (TPR) repeat protein
LAFDLAGRAHAALQEYPAALEALQKAVRLSPKDDKARDHLLLAMYAVGDKRSAVEDARQAVAQHPTDLVPRALLALQGQKEMEDFVRVARDFVGEDDFEMLETSLVFAELGLAQEAAKLLAAACIDAVPEKERSPLPMYYLAWLASLQGDTHAARLWLGRAAATYRDYAFPSRPEELAVFEYALRENPNDAYAHLHIGNLYAHLGRAGEAVGHWQKAAELNKSLSVAHRNLGLYAWAADNDLVKAAQCYRSAIEARPADQTLYRDLAEILIAQGKRPDAIGLLESTPAEGLRRADILIMLAQAYLDEQRYTEGIKLLESTPYFVNWEGQSITWDIFYRSHMKRGQSRFEGQDFAGALQDFEAALTYPENIGVGRSNRPQEATAQYWRGKTLQALGRVEEAKSAWQAGADGAEGSEEQKKHRDLCREALEKI